MTPDKADLVSQAEGETGEEHGHSGCVVHARQVLTNAVAAASAEGHEALGPCLAAVAGHDRRRLVALRLCILRLRVLPPFLHISTDTGVIHSMKF